MRYHDITMDDMKNGDGLRTVLWVSGCDKRCKGCHNPLTWDPNDGLLFDESAKEELFSNLKNDYISGLTISGGDPLMPCNVDDVLILVKEVRSTFPDKTIWIYTGDTWDEICMFPKRMEIMDCIDVLVDGEFVDGMADTKYPWAGSTNQRVIDVHETLESWKERRRIVLYETV